MQIIQEQKEVNKGGKMKKNVLSKCSVCHAKAEGAVKFYDNTVWIPLCARHARNARKFFNEIDNEIKRKEKKR